MSDPIQPYGINPIPTPLLNPVSEWKLQDGTLFNTAFGFSIDSFAPVEPDPAKDTLTQRLLAFLNAPSGRSADDGYMTQTAALVAVRQQLAEAAREVEYERQVRQQTEEAMIKLASRVKEQQAELAEQEAAKWELVQELEGPRYRSTSESMPAEGVTVLLQPRHKGVLPEFGKLLSDHAGFYWQANGQRSTRYDVSNWEGWAYLPAAAPAARGARKESGRDDN